VKSLRWLPVLAVATACGGTPKPAPAPETAPSPASAAAPAPEANMPRVVTLPASQTPVVTLRILFRAGSADDPAGKEGVTALAARMMAEGGTQKLTSYELKQTLFPWAVNIGQSVDKEMTVFTARVHKDQLDQFLPILADVLLHPRWEPSELERMRHDAIDDIEKRLRGNDDEDLGKETLQYMLYAGGPYGHPDQGTVEGLKAITLDDVKGQAQRVFSKARLTIGVAGGWPQDLPQRLQDMLAALPEGTAPGAIPDAKGLDDVKMLLAEKEANSVAFSLGAPVSYDRRDPDFPALMVAISALGEHRQFHGRLMQRLRELRGLNYGDYAYAEHFEQDGWSTFADVNIARSKQYFSIWLRPVRPEQAHFALRAALYEYDKFLKDGLTADELDTVKRFLAGYPRLGENNDSRRLGLALDDAFYGTPNRLAEFRKVLPTLTLEQVNAAIRKHLPPISALRIAVVTDDAAKFKEKVLNNEATPIEYTAPKPQAVLDQDVVIMKRGFDVGAADLRVIPASQLFEK
jgi:zinc protease